MSPHMSSQLRHTSGWDLLVSLGHPTTFQWVSRLGSVAARHSSSRRQLNFAALNRGHHPYSAGRPSCWALDHILILLWYCTITCVAIATTDSVHCCLFLHMTDINEIWHGNAVWPSWAFRLLKFTKFENPRWRPPPSWKIEKSPYLGQSLTITPFKVQGQQFLYTSKAHMRLPVSD